MHTKYRPIGDRRGACRAWPGFETTRRAKLAARTASGRAGPAAVGDQAAGPEGARNTGGAHQTARPSKRASRPLLSADAGLWASRVVDEARHVALEEGGDGRGRARAVLGDDDVGFAGAVFLVVVVGAV